MTYIIFNSNHQFSFIAIRMFTNWTSYAKIFAICCQSASAKHRFKKSQFLGKAIQSMYTIPNCIAGCSSFKSFSYVTKFLIFCSLVNISCSSSCHVILFFGTCPTTKNLQSLHTSLYNSFITNAFTNRSKN